MSRFDQCDACDRDKPAGNLHRFVCGFSAASAGWGALLVTYRGDGRA